MNKKNAKLISPIVAVLCMVLSACNDNDSNKTVNPPAVEEPEVMFTNSEVDFSNCRELAGGITVVKNNLQEQVPDNISVFSLTDMGFFFEGSDDLGMLIVRAISCEAIRVTDSEGEETTDENITFVHVGAPINVTHLPATTYSYDGINSADFNIYTLSYQTSSAAYFNAMERAGLQNAKLNEGIVNEFIDLDAEQCSTASLLVNVPGESEYSFSIFGEVVEATDDCHTGGSDFIANWWSVDSENQVSALSNTVADQTFTESAGENVFIVTKDGTTMNSLIGASSTRFTGFSGSGYLPSGGLGDLDMVIEALGSIAE